MALMAREPWNKRSHRYRLPMAAVEPHRPGDRARDLRVTSLRQPAAPARRVKPRRTRRATPRRTRRAATAPRRPDLARDSSDGFGPLRYHRPGPPATDVGWDRAVFACPGVTVKIVVGLGNPGSQYAQTRHNIGWMVLDRLADRAGWSGRGRQRDAATVAMGRYRSLDVTLVKPLTYMNDSGLAVRKVLARDRAPLGDLLVVADDFALPFGKLRFREAGSHGGHNGLRSIVADLGTEKFSRLRIGIGDPNRGAVDHVLSTFAPDERQRLDELLDAASDAVEAWARDGTNKAANRFNNFELRPADADRVAPPGAVDGPPGPDGIRRTRTGWRRIRLPGLGGGDQ